MHVKHKVSICTGSKVMVNVKITLKKQTNFSTEHKQMHLTRFRSGGGINPHLSYLNKFILLNIYVIRGLFESFTICFS